MNIILSVKIWINVNVELCYVEEETKCAYRQVLVYLEQLYFEYKRCVCGNHRRVSAGAISEIGRTS